MDVLLALGNVLAEGLVPAGAVAALGAVGWVAFYLVFLGGGKGEEGAG